MDCPAVGWSSRAPSLNQLNLAEHAKDKKSDMSQSGHQHTFGAALPIVRFAPNATGISSKNNRAALFSRRQTGAPNFYGVGETTRDVRFDAPNWIVPSKGVSTSRFLNFRSSFFPICFAARKIIQFQILNPPKAQSPPGDRFLAP